MKSRSTLFGRHSDMLAVLYIGHGTRLIDGVRQANQFLYSCMKGISAPIQEICYLERVQPDIREGIRRCIEKGAQIVLIQPLLLLSAGHAKRDIPAVVDEARSLYPDIIFIVGRPLGVDPKIVDILIERIFEKRKIIPENSGIVLVGRGSSDPETKHDFASIRRLLNERGLNRVLSCYMAAARPSFEEGLDLALKKGWEQTFVVPYLLFTGVLMKTLKKAVDLRNKTDTSFVLCSPLGYHPVLIRLMKKRIRESLKNVLPHYT